MVRPYFIGGAYDGCFYYRCFLPATYNGWDVSKGEGDDPQKMLATAKNADLVIFQRPNSDHRVEVMNLLTLSGKAVGFDNDDTSLPDKGVPLEKLTEKAQEVAKILNHNLYEAIKLSKVVIASTEFLAEEYRQIPGAEDKVVVLPNYIDPLDFNEPVYNEGDKIRIGIVGSVAQTDDFIHVKDVIEWISNDDRYELVVFGLPDTLEEIETAKKYKDDMEFWYRIDCEKHAFVPRDQYYNKLETLRLDMSLIPRADTYFNRAKTNVKFLELSMLGIPVIAQGYADGKSPYQVNPKDKNHMILIEDDSKWKKAIEKLSDKDYRREMGARARRYVIRNYNIADHAYKWAEALEKYGS